MRFSESVRAELSKPLGKLLNAKDAVEAARSAKSTIVSVGDAVLVTLLSAGIKPGICIYDFRTMREEIPLDEMKLIEQACPEPLVIDNEPGGISEELEAAIVDALAKGSGNIFVAGEEDLAALAAMRHAKDGTLILYGQPEEGIVLVVSSAETREKAKALMNAGKAGR